MNITVNTDINGRNFYSNYLEKLQAAFSDGNVAIIDVHDKNTGNISKALALVSLNEATRVVQFIPIAELYNSNPMNELSSGAVRATLKPMDAWQEKANSKPLDISLLN